MPEDESKPLDEGAEIALLKADRLSREAACQDYYLAARKIGESGPYQTVFASYQTGCSSGHGVSRPQLVPLAIAEETKQYLTAHGYESIIISQSKLDLWQMQMLDHIHASKLERASGETGAPSDGLELIASITPVK